MTMLSTSGQEGFWERLFFCSPVSSSPGLREDVMPGVTAAILGHEVTNIKKKPKNPHAEVEGMKG